MGGEDGGDIDAALFGREELRFQPAIRENELRRRAWFHGRHTDFVSLVVREERATYLSQKPCDQIAKDNGFIGLMVLPQGQGYQQCSINHSSTHLKIGRLNRCQTIGLEAPPQSASDHIVC